MQGVVREIREKEKVERRSQDDSVGLGTWSREMTMALTAQFNMPEFMNRLPIGSDIWDANVTEYFLYCQELLPCFVEPLKPHGKGRVWPRESTWCGWLGGENGRDILPSVPNGLTDSDLTAFGRYVPFKTSIKGHLTVFYSAVQRENRSWPLRQLQ